MKRLTDGELGFRDPKGWLIPDAPKLPAVPADGGETLRLQTTTAGVDVDANTLRPRWDGTRLDLHYAISVMHPRANGDR